MDIHRNEMRHRYYTEKDIEVLSKVRDLKEKGLQLKAIRNYLEMRRQQLAQEKGTKTDAVVAVAEGTYKENEQKETDNRHALTKTMQEVAPVEQRMLTNEEKMQQFQQIMEL